MDMLEILTKARAYIAHGFCRNSWARDRSDEEVLPTSPMACCWCVVGALRAALYKGRGRPVTAFNPDLTRAVKALLKARGHRADDPDADYEAMRVADISDGLDQQDALAWIDKAIALNGASCHPVQC